MAKKLLGNQNSLDEIILAAFGAGSICTLITNPISVVRSRILLTDRDKRNNKYLSISSTLKQIIKNEGFQGLYKVSTTIFLDLYNSLWSSFEPKLCNLPFSVFIDDFFSKVEIKC